ncbi:MAG TPA: hypothetical protein PKH10_08090 [bacterium]|nr:hypothetical protein [bacterium]
MSGLAETISCSKKPSIFLDYSVIDHLFRIQEGSYNGPHSSALQSLRYLAEKRGIDVWISEITPVEMLLGTEKIELDAKKKEYVAKKDKAKLSILKSMGVRTLGYPCSKFDDDYSRLDLSFRLAEEESGIADEVEKQLLTIPGVSCGDARQVVSCAFPFDSEKTEIHPRIEWFVAEDLRLIKAINGQIKSGKLGEIAHLKFGCTETFLNSYLAMQVGRG